MADTVIEAEIKSNVGEVADQTERLADATDDAKKGFKGLGGTIKGIGTALKAAGIGLIVALLAKLMEVFSKNQKVVDVFNTAMTSLSIAFNDLFKYLDENYEVIKGYLKGIFTDPLGELAKLGLGIEKFFIEKMKGASMVLKGVATLMANISNPKMFAVGMAQIAAGTVVAGKEIAAIYTEIESAVTGYVSTVVDQAKVLTDVSKAAQLAEVQFAKLNAEYLREAEIQRQIRDDVSKTFAERIAANNELSKVLSKQAEDQKAQLQIQLDAATQAWSINKENIDLIIAKGQAENAMAELKETITGQESEQLTNQIALEEELRQGREQSLIEGTSGLERELAELENSYNEKKRLAIKSGIDTTAITKQYEKQKSDLIKANINEQLEAFSGLAGALSSLAGDNKALAVAQAVIDTYAGANKALAQGGVAGFVTGAAVIAAGLANVRKILSTDVPGSTNPPPPSISGTPAPEMLSGQFTLGGVQEQQPVQAYVVTDDMTNNQNKLANIRRRATI